MIVTITRRTPAAHVKPGDVIHTTRAGNPLDIVVEGGAFDASGFKLAGKPVGNPDGRRVYVEAHADGTVDAVPSADQMLAVEEAIAMAVRAMGRNWQVAFNGDVYEFEPEVAVESDATDPDRTDEPAAGVPAPA